MLALTAPAPGSLGKCPRHLLWSHPGLDDIPAPDLANAVCASSQQEEASEGLSLSRWWELHDAPLQSLVLEAVIGWALGSRAPETSSRCKSRDVCESYHPSSARPVTYQGVHRPCHQLLTGPAGRAVISEVDSVMLPGTPRAGRPTVRPVRSMRQGLSPHCPGCSVSSLIDPATAVTDGKQMFNFAWRKHSEIWSLGLRRPFSFVPPQKQGGKITPK